MVIIIKKILFFTISIVLLLSSAAYANTVDEADWNMWHGVQDALILGEISKIEKEATTIVVEKCLSGKAIIDEQFRQLPESEIGELIIIKNLNFYRFSYSGKTQPAIGDYIIVSIDKNGNEWVANWEPFEVSSLDYASLELEPSDKTTAEGTAWLNFIRSDGHVNDFTIVREEGYEQVSAKGIFDDGKVVEEIIFERKSTDFVINAKIQRNIQRIKMGVTISSVFLIIALFINMTKRKSKK